MIYKNIDEIEEADLQSLITNSVVEKKTIEYKREIDISSNDKKKEFLYDVSSFANASGGDIIYGISEIDGVPDQLIGIDISNKDGEILKIEGLIRDSIAPRISGIITKILTLANSKHILIIRIPKSWNSPHQVTHGGTDKFYSRATNGKYRLDVVELRRAFTLSESLNDRIRKIKEERISKIIANEGAITLGNGAKIIMHLMPLTSFDTTSNYDLKSIFNTTVAFPPLGHGGYDTKYNFDGALNYGIRGLHSYYALFFKNGIIETVNQGSLGGVFKNKKIIYGDDYETTILRAFKKYLLLYKQFNIGTPVIASLTLTDVKGYSMGTSGYYARNPFSEPVEIDRDILVLPDILIEDFDIPSHMQLKQWFDSIWNACGYERSWNYEENANFKHRYD